MMEKNKFSILQEEEMILQWIKKAELDLTFVEEIYSAGQCTHSNGQDVSLATV